MAEQIGEQFMARTRYAFLGPSDQAKGLPAPPLEMDFGGSAERISLPPARGARTGRLGLLEAIEGRRSIRDYSSRPLSLQDLSLLLWCTQGVKQVVAGSATLRTVPSAGARHAFETYLLVNRVETLAAGLYRFLAIAHQLASVRLGAEIADEIAAACFGQHFIRTCAVAFIWVADACRMTWRYGQRGYRYLHLDAGHVCQNLYLSAEAIGSGVCAVGAFDDDRLNAALGLDGRRQFAVYLAAAGGE